MRIALCLRGISFLSNYNHPGNSVHTHDLDFRNTAPSIQQNLIDPFKQQGHEVDVYFVTYHSELEDELIKFYNPKGHSFTNFKILDYHGNSRNIIEQHLKCIELYESSQVNYDHVIITRFDLYFYKSILDIGIDYKFINLLFYHHGDRNIFSSEDNFIMYPGDKTNCVKESISDLLMNLYNQDLRIYRTSHNIADFLMKKGERIYYLFGEKGSGAYDYPFYKFARHIFGTAKEFNDIKDILNIPMNRIYHSKEEKEGNCGIYYPL